MSKSWIFAAILIAAGLTGCDRSAPPAPEVRPVRTVTVQRPSAGETFSLTGQVRAKDQVNLAFRIDGRVTERAVDVGDTVKAGQVVARLDPQDQENLMRTAKADLAAAQAQLTDSRLTFARQAKLLPNGWTPQAKYDEAQQNMLAAEAKVDAAQARLRLAQDQLSYTTLVADAAGSVTAKGAEPGEVVRAGQMIVQLAHEGARDAVFDVPEQIIRTGPRNPLVTIELTNDPTVKATGRVREIAPQADLQTRTYQVKVAIIDPPPAMRLGATVTGRVTLPAPPGIEVPASALTQSDDRPAVWVVDPRTQTVSLRSVDVVQYDPATVVVAKGLETGDVVVTAGVQTLRPGQKVRVLGAA